jgi:uncharacterized membrane protein
MIYQPQTIKPSPSKLRTTIITIETVWHYHHHHHDYYHYESSMSLSLFTICFIIVLGLLFLFLFCCSMYSIGRTIHLCEHKKSIYANINGRLNIVMLLYALLTCSLPVLVGMAELLAQTLLITFCHFSVSYSNVTYYGYTTDTVPMFTISRVLVMF